MHDVFYLLLLFLMEYQTNNSDENNISIDNLTLCVSETTNKKTLLENTDLKITLSQRYGLIGKNGIGKTTLLKQIASKKHTHPKMDIFYMEQDVTIDDLDESIINCVLKAHMNRYELFTRRDELNKLIETDGEDDGNYFNEFNEVNNKIHELGLEGDVGKVEKILLGLGFEKKQMNMKFRLLSGGWRMRVVLARALYLEPMLLLLDEPTNHLDLNATIWLSNYLSLWKKNLIIISHNQALLNEVCTCIINIENKKLVYYRGNYYKFSQMFKQNQQKLLIEWEKFQKEIKTLRKKGNVTKETVDKMTLDKLKKGIYEPEKEYIVNITFNTPSELVGTVIQMQNVTFGYDGNILIEDMDIGLDNKTRMTIVGNNGSGKTTIMNLMIGLLQPKSGSIIHNQFLRIGYYNQHFVDTLPEDLTPIQYLMNVNSINGKLTEQDVRKYLGTIGLEGATHKMNIKNLSGGQKARVVLCSIQIMEPHMLFLDEPTNHLDIETINALIDGINNFTGGVVMISHDMNLITETNSDLWVCRNKSLKRFDGDYEEYKAIVLQ